MGKSPVLEIPIRTIKYPFKIYGYDNGIYVVRSTVQAHTHALKSLTETNTVPKRPSHSKLSNEPLPYTPSETGMVNASTENTPRCYKNTILQFQQRFPSYRLRRGCTTGSFASIMLIQQQYKRHYYDIHTQTQKPYTDSKFPAHSVTPARWIMLLTVNPPTCQRLAL